MQSQLNIFKEPILVDPLDYIWIKSQIEDLTDERISRLVSEWCENRRYLPPELTKKPGFWDNTFTPYLVEIMDCFSVKSDVQKVAFMKGSQIGATTGVLENDFGYTIEEDPCGYMYVSADKQLTKLSIEVKIDRMLQSCNLQDKIRPADEKSRKTGNTSTKKDFPGGFLLAVGAQNPGRLKSMTVRKLRMDELDSMPDTLGDAGDPIKVAERATKGFGDTRSILYISTPLVLQTSKIYKEFKKGDQRYYNIPCPHCGKYQILEFRGETKSGKRYGIIFDLDEKNNLIEDSVRYQCKHCDDQFYNHDKTDFLIKGKWVPTATPKEKNYRSYHLNSLYSPVGMYSWLQVVYDYMDAWDVVGDRVKDISSYRTFWNEGLGMPYEEKGEMPAYERVIQHRRAIYSKNEIPNKYAVKEAGSIIHLLTAAADVHKERIDVEIIGWCKYTKSYSIDWRHYEGDTEDLYSEDSPWQKMREMIENEIWVADDGKRYQIQLTLIDARYRTDTVYQFAGEYENGVFPIMGRDTPPKTAKLREFSEYTSKAGTPAFNLNVTVYKDRLSSFFRRDWNEGKLQPLGYPNFPEDYSDDYFRHYESEYKQTVKSRKTNKIIGYYWVKIPGKPNHAFDCRVYNMAALDIIIYYVCLEIFEFDGINYIDFWQWVEEEEPYFTTG